MDSVQRLKYDYHQHGEAKTPPQRDAAIWLGQKVAELVDEANNRYRDVLVVLDVQLNVKWK